VEISASTWPFPVAIDFCLLFVSLTGVVSSALAIP